MDLIEYVAALRKRWVLILVLAFLGASAGFGYAKVTPPTYESTSQVFVSVDIGNTVGELAQGSTYTQNLVQSYAQLATAPAVLRPVIRDLGLSTTATRLARRITASTPLNTVIIEITATSGSARESAQIANAIAKQLPRTVRDVSPTAAGNSPISIETIAEGVVPRFAVAPNTRFLTATGLLAGLLLGVAIAVLSRVLDTRIRDRRDLEQMTDAPLLGEVPRWRGSSSKQVAMLTNPRGARSEAYRRVRSNFEFVTAAQRAYAVVITSAQHSEGKSTTATNFALAMAEQHKRVVLVDADLRRPTVADVSGLEGAVGLTTVLIGRASLSEVIQPWSDTGVHVMTSGAIPPNPLQLLDSAAMLQVIAELRRRYDVVILDAPPLLPVADAAVLAKHVDGAVLTVSSGRSRRRQLRTALENLAVAKASVLGIILTRVQSSRDQTYYQQKRGPLRSLLRRLGGRDRRTSPAKGVPAAGAQDGLKAARSRVGHWWTKARPTT